MPYNKLEVRIKKAIIGYRVEYTLTGEGVIGLQHGMSRALSIAGAAHRGARRQVRQENRQQHTLTGFTVEFPISR